MKPPPHTFQRPALSPNAWRGILHGLNIVALSAAMLALFAVCPG